MLKEAEAREKGATIFGYYVPNPKDFGVVEFDSEGKAISSLKKSQKSLNRIIRLYFYDDILVEKAKK